MHTHPENQKETVIDRLFNDFLVFVIKKPDAVGIDNYHS